MAYSRRRKAKRELAEEKQKSYEGSSVEKLKREVKTRCKTIFVGAVVKLEEHFGILWNEVEALDESEMTPEQLKWFNAFLDAREQIFDQGNDQLSKLLSEVDEYHISWNRQQIIFTKDLKK